MTEPIPPADLRAALEAAGFTLDADGVEVAVWRWPAGGGQLVVPTSAGRHYPAQLVAVWQVLAEAAHRGEAANAVLDAIAGWRPVGPDDGERTDG